MNNDASNPLLEIPEFVRECPELKARGIEVGELLKPLIAWRTPRGQSDVKPYAVKIVKESSQEAEIYDQLRQYDRASPNHSLPCDVIRSESNWPILVMPCAGMYNLQVPSNWNTSEILDCCLQIVEGLEFLHDRHIAHLDLRPDNLLFARQWDVRYSKDELELDKVYIIDFSESRQLPYGPGQQPPIDLPQSILPKPLDMQHFDPYSFDVYSLGDVIECTLAICYWERPKPWILERYAQWLIGTERGCTGVCRCRPTARRARQVLVLLRWVVRGWTLVTNTLYTLRSLFSPHKPTD